MSDPFEALGLPARFGLERAEIERAYLARAAGLHPDHQPGVVGAGAGPEVGAGGGEASEAGDIARLNAARATLLDAEKRAWALVMRLGGGGGGGGGAADRALPAGFLEAMLEAREQMEGERGQAGAAERWEAWAEERRSGHVREVGRLLDEAAGQVDGSRAGVLAAVRRELNAWRYVERMLEQIGED